MKRTGLDVIVCPSCHGTLDLETVSRHGEEIVEGTLHCAACRRAFPITRGIPRFVPSGAYAQSFGRQWNWFRRVQLDSANGRSESRATFEATTGWTPADYRGRLVLDAGVGAGRFAEVVAHGGGEIVGIDLTTAVDAAYANVGHQDRVHLVQGDILAMPFRAGTFDLAYSIGVLHHTPSPPLAFARLATTVKPGGALAVYVYSRHGAHYHGSDFVRRVTTRLPHRLMLGIAAVAVPLYWVYRLPVVGRALALALPISMHPDWRWRWLDTFDWYTPTYQWKYLYPEVFRWFREAGFRDVEIFDEPIRMRGVRAGAVASASAADSEEVGHAA